MADEPATVPETGTGRTLLVEDIRHFIWDRTAEDNPLELDLSFSDPEIGHAWRHTALLYNSLKPRVNTLNGSVIPSTLEYPFMLGVVGHLFLAKARVLAERNIDYSAGNMSVSIDAKRLEYYMKQGAEWLKEAKAELTAYKEGINILGGFACY